ncbi:MAG TPA: hypothetical protein VJA21_10755 [Verrucomicrobiae bacterium]
MKQQIRISRAFGSLLLVGIAFALAEARSETLVIGTNQPVNFSLTVPTNQAVVIYGGRFAATQPDIYWRLTQFGQLYLFRIDAMSDPILTPTAGHPNILAGPLVLELFIPQTAEFNGSWMSYQVLPLTGLKTMILPGATTNSVSIPASTNFRVLSSSIRDWATGGTWQLVSGNARATLPMETISLMYDMEFSGPIRIDISNNFMDARWLTYSLHNGSVQLLPAGVIAASGANALSVEESSDLVNWSVAAVMLKGAAPSRFYRLKDSR